MGRGSVAPAAHVWLDAEAAGAIADFGPVFTGLLLCLGVLSLRNSEWRGPCVGVFCFMLTVGERERAQTY